MLHRRRLRRMHHVDRRLPGLDDLPQRLRQRCQRPREDEGYGPLGIGHHFDLSVRTPQKIIAQPAHVA